MDNINIQKGLTVYLVPCGNNARMGAPSIVEGTIVTVGRKYYTVAMAVDYHCEYKFNIDSLRQQTNYTPDYLLYFDKQEILDKNETDGLLSKFYKYFGSVTGKHNTLTLDQLRRINAIIEESENAEHIQKIERTE